MLSACRKVKNRQDMETHCNVSLDNRLSWIFHMKLFGCLLTILRRNYCTSCFEQQTAFYRVEALLQTAESLQLSLQSILVITLWPLIYITAIAIKMNWPSRVYLSTSFEGIFFLTKVYKVKAISNPITWDLQTSF